MTKFLRRFSNSSEATIKKPTDTTLPPTTETTSTLPEPHESEKAEASRRENAFYWYKLLEKPTKGTMCSIVEYIKDIDFTRQDIDLLPWNFRETKVSEEAMKAPKRKERKVKKKKDKKVVECAVIEDTSFVVSEESEAEEPRATRRSSIEDRAFQLDIATVLNEENERPTLEKGQVGESWRSLDFIHMDNANKVNGYKKRPTFQKARMGESWTSLNFSWNENGSSNSLDDASYDSWAPDGTKGEGDSEEFDAAWLKAEAAEEAAEAEEAEAAEAAAVAAMENSDSMLELMHSSLEIGDPIMTEQGVEEEQENKRGERQRKAEAAWEAKVYVPENISEKITVEDLPSEMTIALNAFQWYARMATPSRRDFKQKVAAQDWIDIKCEDVDLLPWNEAGSAVSVAKMNTMIRASMQKQ
jgi:hypothetical protein